VSNGEVHSEWCAVIVRPAIRDAAVRTVTVFCCKDRRQIITNADSPTLCRRTACVHTVSHLTLSRRPGFRVTAVSTLTSYLWMHVKLLYPPPPGWFHKPVSSNSYAYFLGDQPSVASTQTKSRNEFHRNALQVHRGVYCCACVKGGRGGGCAAV